MLQAKTAQPSIGEVLFSIEKLINDYRITSTIGHLCSFAKAKTAAERLAYLVCIANNYQTGTTVEFLTEKLAASSHVASFIQWCLSLYEKITQKKLPDLDLPAVDIPNPDDVTLQMADVPQAYFNPIEGLEQSDPQARTFIDHLDSMLPIIRPILGFIAFFACAMGFNQLLEMTWLSNVTKDVVKLASLIKAKKTIYAEVQEGTDQLLSMLYSAMGRQYYSEKEQVFVSLGKRINNLRDYVQLLVDRTQYDVFGLLRGETLETLTKELQKIEAEVMAVISREKSTLNFARELSSISKNLEILRARRSSIISGGDKQTPVRVWFYSAPGNGKTHIANQLANCLSEGKAPYTRSSGDQYMSGYIGQSVVIYDDIFQRKAEDAPDVMEYIKYTTGSAQMVNMAALEEKGTPFTSRFIIATSNYAFAPDHAGVASPAAFDRRRDYLVYTVLPGLDEWKKNNSGEPTNEWYETHKQRFFLFNPIGPHLTPPTPKFIKGIPTADTPGFIGEVSYNELVTMCKELERSRAEKLRLRLIERFEDNPRICIPSEPFKFNVELFDTNRMFDPKTKQRRHAWPDLPKSSDYVSLSQDSDWSVDDDVTEQIQHNPVVRMTDARCYALVISGPPGIGKSHAILRFLHDEPYVRIDSAYIDANPNWLNENNGKDQFVFFDDFSVSEKTLAAFRTIIEAVSRGAYCCKGLIGTCNWKIIKDKETKNMIRRRSTLLRLSMHWSTFVTSTVEEYLEKKCGDDQTKRDACIQVTATGEGKAAFGTYSQLSAGMMHFFGSNSKTTTTEIVRSFELPPPTHYDYIIDLDFKPNATVAEVAKAVAATQVYRRTIKGDQPIFTPVSSNEKFAVMMKLTPFFKSKAYGNTQQFTSIFNAEKHPKILEGAILVKFWGQQMGFVAQGDYTYAFGIDSEAGQIQIIDGEPWYEGKPLVFTPGNFAYQSIIRKLFDESPPPIPEAVVSEESLGLMFMRSSPLGHIIGVILGVLPLVVHSLAVVSLISSCIPSAKPKENTKEEEIQNESKEANKDIPPEKEEVKDILEEEGRPNRKQSDDSIAPSPTGPKNGSTPKNNIVLEARPKRNDNNDGIPPSPTGKNQASAPKNNISLESKPSRNGGDDAIPPSPQGPKKGATPKNNIALEAVRPKKNKPKRSTPPYEELYTPETVPEAAAYDTIQRRAAHTVMTLESRDWPDGSLVFEKKQQYYGIAWNESIIYLAEHPTSRWRALLIPRSDAWERVDVTPIDCFGRTFRPTTNLSADTSSLMMLIGLSFDTMDNPDVDLASVVAYAFTYGLPYDAFSGKFEWNILPRVFNPTDQNPIPSLLRKHVAAHKPAMLPSFDFRMKQEGMIDPELRTQTSQTIKQVYSIRKDKRHQVFGIGIGKRLILTVGHVADITNLTIFINDKDWPIHLASQNKSCDLAVFEIRDKTFPEFKNISHVFVNADQLTGALARNATAFPLQLVTKDPDGNQVFLSFAVGAALQRATSETSYRGRSLEYRAVVSSVCVTGLTIGGDCGSPVFMINKAFSGKLIALHRAGNATKSVATLVTQQWIESMLLDPRNVLNDIQAESAHSETQELLDQSSDIPVTLLNGGEEETMQYRVLHAEEIILAPGKRDDSTGLLRVGYLPKSVFAPDATRLNRTGIDFPEGSLYEPSIMNRSDPRAPGYDPRLSGLKRYGENYLDDEIDTNEVMECALEIANELATRITARGKRLHQFSNTEAINSPGVLEYHNAKPLDRAGSAGFPSCVNNPGTTKGDFLYFNEKHQKWYFKPEAAQQVNNINKIINDAAQGREHIHPLVAYCKDEPLKLKKIYEAPKTRIFFSCPFEYLMCFRRFFNSAMYRVQEMYADIPPKIGISATMTDWHYMTSRLLKVSPYGFASDMANFDSSVPKIFIEACGVIWNELYSRCSERGEDVIRDNRIREILHRSIEGAYIISRRNLYKLSQAQVSGNPATAIENSFVVWMLYYLVWKRLALQHAPDLANYASFRKNVELACYGDDNVCSVNQACPWFNFNTFRLEAKKFGFSVTDALKLGKDVPDFMPIDQLDFLKRKFHNIKGLYVGPLEMESIKKACYWIRDVRYNVTKDVVGNWPQCNNRELIQTSIDALWKEIALHGQETYAEMRDHLLRESQLVGIELHPPTWKQAMLEFGYTV